MQQTFLNITLLFALSSFLFVSNSSAYKAGLPVPTWFKAMLIQTTTPELNLPFDMEFELQNLLGDLTDISLTLELPPGVEIVSGKASQVATQIRKAEIKKWRWTLKVTRETLGEPVQLTLSTKVPREEIIRSALINYGSEASHQVNQLVKKINNMNDRVNLHFHSDINCLPSEGLATLPQYIFRRTWKPKTFDNYFLMLDFAEPRNVSKKKLTEEINKLSEYITNLKTDSEMFTKMLEQRPKAYIRMLEDLFFLHYSIAILEFNNGNFSESDLWLQKMSVHILKEEELNSELFLAVQNTRALCAIAMKKYKEAKKILRSSIETELHASVRYYLLYNLAVTMKHLKNHSQMTIYAERALKLNPALTIAKQLIINNRTK